VFTDYRPKEHKLSTLNKKAIEADKRFASAFPLITLEEKDRFDLLVRAYIDARYRMKKYYITHEDLEYLGERVETLRNLTEEICQERIEGI
jgi:uncharacterized protein